MDIWNILQDRVLMQYFIWGGAIVLVVFYMIGRIIYFALFPSKRNWRTKSFEDEVAEHRNQPISDSETIGSISMRLGEDVRDVLGMGYSNDQINGVLTGHYSLNEMYVMEPEGNTTSATGEEFLAKKRKEILENKKL